MFTRRLSNATNPTERISVELVTAILAPNQVIDKLASISGPIDVYCWYEGPRTLSKPGALFLKDHIFKPILSRKKDLKLYLYSLNGWDFKKNINTMNVTTDLGETINKVNKKCIECLYSASFFKFCKQATERRELYEFLKEELPRKKDLIGISEPFQRMKKTVRQLFEGESLFDGIKDMDVRKAYSLIQYVEGYYLVQESVRRGLREGNKKIQVAFVLPNDEAKYYADFPRDLEKMLRKDFGNALNGVEVTVLFHFFSYGTSHKDRPYLGDSTVGHVNLDDVTHLFDFIKEMD